MLSEEQFHELVEQGSRQFNRDRSDRIVHMIDELMVDYYPEYMAADEPEQSKIIEAIAQRVVVEV